MAFHDDIKSKHLSNFVLVTIGDDIHISTQKIIFDEDYYKPILLNVPSISESLDIEQRKYKISSVSLSISDYEEDGERFSNNLNTLMNKEVNIYYASQSCLNLDECYKAGTYIVRSFSQDEDKVALNCEDLSQDKLHQDFPLESLPDDDIILDKYRGKPIPMVFGAVDRSPCVIDGSGDDKLIISDYNPDENFNYNKESFNIGENNTYINSPLYIFNNDSYVNIADKKPFDNSSTLSNSGIINFTEDTDNGRIILESSIDNNDTSLENLRIISVRKPTNVGGVITSNQGSNYSGDAYLNLWNPDSAKEDTSDYASLSGEETQPDPTSEEPQLLGSIDPRRVNSDSDIYDQDYWSKSFYIKFQNVSNINTSDIVLDEDGNPVDNFTWIYYKFQHANSIVNAVFPRWNIRVGDVYGSEYLLEPTESVELHDSINGNTPVLKANNFSITDAGKRIIIGYGRNDIISGGDELLYCRAKLYHIFIIHSAVIKGIDKHLFFTNTIGRKGEAPSSQSIYTEILSELDFGEELINTVSNDIELGKYAFTIDKKINSKKLIEELSQSTPLYPYFKDGEFRVKSIKWKDENGDGYKFSDVYPKKRIKAEDVINYKYDRTKVEKVYNSGVNVKYHYDYGLKDFTKETGNITPNESSDSMNEYTNETFGDDFDQEFVFESKYIRNEETALNLAKYLAGLHANQHNIINLTLPLNYLTFELGDIVGFDKLVQDRKMFGEDYTKLEVRNGQEILPIFFVNKIKKSLDKVEISLYQLHNFSNNAYVEEEIPEEPDIVLGCLNDQAINFNPLANTSQDVGNFGACFFPIEITPPEITSHEIEEHEVVNPELNITWNKSNNIHEYIPELDLNTINNAYYKVFIYGQQVDGSSPVFYESDAIYDNSIENSEFSHTVDIGEIGIPQNEVVAVVIQSFNNAMYNEQFIYSNSPTTGFTLVWGEDEGETDTTIIGGDVNLDGNINVADIVIIVNSILGITELDSEMFLEADMNGDGFVNVADIVQIVYKILDQ